MSILDRNETISRSISLKIVVILSSFRLLSLHKVIQKRLMHVYVVLTYCDLFPQLIT